jgi:hypothetical protein
VASFSIVLISKVVLPSWMVKPGSCTVTSVPASFALPRRMPQFGASVPSSKSSTKSRAPPGEPKLFPSISKRSHDELKNAPRAGKPRPTMRATTTTNPRLRDVMCMRSALLRAPAHGQRILGFP